jgi:hypothetical protein
VLQIEIPLAEAFDEDASEFRSLEAVTLNLEHSLVSLSKWESRWEKPFLGDEEKTEEQTLDYVRAMILGRNPPGEAFSRLSADNIKEINEYINARMTATWFTERPEPKKAPEVVTAEVIYYSMIALGIPFECQYWHLNRLLTLIRVCNIKNKPAKNMTRGEMIARQREINAERRQKYGSRG